MDIQFDVERRFTTVTVRGPLTIGVARETLSILYAEDVRPDRVLWDLSEGTLPPRPDAVMRLVDFIREHRGKEGARKVAIVVSSPGDFGLSRMYEALSSDLPFEVMVFRTSTDAKAWMGV
ncbi:MAG: hypothetical protein P8R42_11635 [Candidatus Binatia bacterium]|nr:hypothetical protein [Candidatus Binatia bacterium]